MSDGALCLPYPELLPANRHRLRAAIADGPHTSAPEPLDSAMSGVRADPATVDYQEADYQEHDRYFQIRRTRQAPESAFLHALAIAHLAVRENVEENGLSQLSDGYVAQLWLGLESLYRYAGHDVDNQPIGVLDQPVQRPPHPQSNGTDPGDSDAAAERWLIGHQFFFTLMQGAITGLNCFLGASADGDEAEARAALRVATAFMRSSAAAFRFTSDFSPVDYERLIRPAMAPPAVRAGFSGLQTRDHAHLMALFTEVRAMRSKIGPARLGSAFDEFVEATVEAYEAHQLICARFGGDVLPSLRMAARSAGRSTSPGVQVVRQMMRARLFALHGSHRDRTDGDGTPGGPEGGGTPDTGLGGHGDETPGADAGGQVDQPAGGDRC
ncbi:hypothetical protein ACN27J_17845 [Solwaraspora sp. WMMB762]|uniref:hypothetical protein n=1 Tax=Solwaraspora sp. WMMB762 TaxID=3404120 RepID=UPI003B938500